MFEEVRMSFEDFRSIALPITIGRGAKGYAKYDPETGDHLYDVVYMTAKEKQKFIGLIKNNEFIKIYKISNVNRKFKILYDSINNKYLLISLDNSKSYIVFANSLTIANYIDYHRFHINLLEIFNDNLFEFKVVYIGNSIYYTEKGYICRLDLNTNLKSKIICSLATETTLIKVIDNTIILITSNEILKIKL